MQMLPRFAMLQKVPIEITVPGNAGIEKGGEWQPLQVFLPFHLFQIQVDARHMLSMDWDKN